MTTNKDYYWWKKGNFKKQCHCSQHSQMPWTKSPVHLIRMSALFKRRYDSVGPTTTINMSSISNSTNLFQVNPIIYQDFWNLARMRHREMFTRLYHRTSFKLRTYSKWFMSNNMQPPITRCHLILGQHFHHCGHNVLGLVTLVFSILLNILY